jgi:CHAT domain-containing protein
MTHNNLGSAFQDRIRGERAENVEQAIGHYEHALQVYTREVFPEDWARIHHNLGSAYQNRTRGERAENLEQAIRHCEQALEVRTWEAFPQDWAGTFSNLGSAYNKRMRGERAENLEQAIGHYEQALKVRTWEAFPQDWAMTHNNLGIAYQDRIRGERAENLELAFRHFEQALQVYTSEAFPEQWAWTHINLGNAYSIRIRGERAENLEQAIGHYQQALQVYTRTAFPERWAIIHHNLGIAYSERIRGEGAENLEQAIGHYEQALQFYTPSAMPANGRSTAAQLGRTLIELGKWNEASKAFGTAREADELLYQAALGAPGQEVELAETRDLYTLSAYAAARADQTEQALEVFEQGRARQMREMLEQNRRDLARLEALGYRDLYRRYQVARERWASLNAQSTAGQQPSALSLARSVEVFTQLERLHNEIGAIVAEIRSVPGFENFLRTLPAEEILKLSEQIPLIYMAATNPGGIALVAYQGQIHSLWPESLSERRLREAMLGLEDDLDQGGYLGAYDDWRKTVGDQQLSLNEKQAAHERWRNAIEAATAWLWAAGMEQVVSFLEEIGADQAVFIPLGILGLLPLHAAWVEDTNRPCKRRYAMDEILFRYTPSAYALMRSKKRVECPIESVLIVDNPDETLMFSGEETAAVNSHFSDGSVKWLMYDAATKQQVIEKMQSAHLLHFSTHGLAIPRAPLESFLLLADRQRLRLGDIQDLRLEQARLAVLSACETGIPGTKLFDEVVSLPSGWMQAGVPGVIGSLWSVGDVSTMMLMARFYDLWRDEGLQPSEALRKAQIWLRDTTNGEKEEYFKKSLSEYQRVKMPETSAREALHQMLLHNKDERSFTHPFYWAAFGYWGI